MPSSGSTTADCARSSFFRATFALHRRKRSIGRIDRTGGAVDFQAAAAREAHRGGYRKRTGKRKIAHRNRDLVIDDGFPFAGGRSQRDASIRQVKLGHADVRRRTGRFCRRFGRLRRLIPERGEIPHSIAVAQQSDLRMLDEKLSDIEPLAENQRQQFDAHLQRFCLHKRRAAELRIVSDGELVGFHAAREDAQAQIPNFHWPSQRRAQARLNLRTETVDVHQQRENDSDHNQNRNDNACHFQGVFHNNTSSKAGPSAEGFQVSESPGLRGSKIVP